MKVFEDPVWSSTTVSYPLSKHISSRHHPITVPLLTLTPPPLQVAAKDKDVERPADIVYFLTGQGIDVDRPPNSMFTVNRTSGDIYVTKVRQMAGRG